MARSGIAKHGPTYRNGTPVPLHTCRDCAESYDWHSMSLKGEPILCRCRWYMEGRYCVFLKNPQCEHFIMRQEEKQHAQNNSQQG